MAPRTSTPEITREWLYAKAASLKPGTPSWQLLGRALHQLNPQLAVQQQPQDEYARQWRADTRFDVKLFAEHFFPHYTTDPFCTMHDDFFGRWATQAGDRGLHEATAAPRGYAKTSLRALVKLAHDVCHVHEQFIVVISSRHDQALDKVRDLRDALESPEIARVFGAQEGSRWNEGDFITSGNVRVLAASRRQQIRGLNWHGLRPSKVLLDDSERSDEVLSEVQREKMWQWLMADIMKIGTQDTNFDIVGTILHPQSMLERLLSDPTSRFDPYRYKAIIRYADQAPEKWQHWRDLYVSIEKTRMEARAEARAYFEANEAEMLAGHVVLWPEHESYYDLMEMILTEGEAAFELEKQNNPVIPTMFPFDMDAAAYFQLDVDRLRFKTRRDVLMGEIEDLALYWDPALGGEEGEPDYSVAVVMGKDVRGYYHVLDAYCSNRDPMGVQITHVAQLAYAWKVPHIGVETNNFQSLVLTNLKQAIAQVILDEGSGWNPGYREIKNTRNKVLRISTLEPWIANGWLTFNARLGGEFFLMFKNFRPIKDFYKDDAPDAVEGCLRLLRGLFDQKSAA